MSELQLVNQNSGRVGRHHARDTRSWRPGLWPVCDAFLGTSAAICAPVVLCCDDWEIPAVELLTKQCSLSPFKWQATEVTLCCRCGGQIGSVCETPVHCIGACLVLRMTIPLLLVLCIMLDSECVLFIVKCPCSPRIYDTLIIFINNNNNMLL